MHSLYLFGPFRAVTDSERHPALRWFRKRPSMAFVGI
jgi:hypothetical protein